MKSQISSSLKTSIIDIGTKSGYDVYKDYDVGAGPIDVVWTLKPGRSELLPLSDLKIGFIFLKECSESTINLTLARSILNLMDKLIILVQSDSEIKQVRDSLGRKGDGSALVQLSNYVSIITPKDLEKPTVFKANPGGNSNEGGNLPARCLEEMIV
jgi:hypothetical protein